MRRSNYIDIEGLSSRGRERGMSSSKHNRSLDLSSYRQNYTSPKGNQNNEGLFNINRSPSKEPMHPERKHYSNHSVGA